MTRSPTPVLTPPRPEPRPRIKRRALNGVLLLDKPIGPSSNQALQVVKRLYRAESAGHTGTLDPFASGLLPVAFGEATKFSQNLLDADKAYRATLRLGERTTTGDCEGEVVASRAVTATRADFETALPRFTGPIDQIPPMYSALKRDGKPLYEYARRGEELARAPRRIIIHRLELVSWAAPSVVIDVRCSKGTYIRTLAEDLGEALGCGAHLTALRRTEVGRYNLDSVQTPEQIAAAQECERDQWLLPIDALIADLPRLTLAPTDTARLKFGQPITPPAGTQPGRFRLYAGDSGTFIGVGSHDPDGRLRPIRLVNTGGSSGGSSAGSGGRSNGGSND